MAERTSHNLIKEDVELKVNQISINNDFWLTFKNHLVSFGYSYLPKDIHFTISFSENNPLLNVHITKNINTNTAKPQIRVLEIDKNELKNYFETNPLILLYCMLDPLDVNVLLQKHKNLNYISFEVLLVQNNIFEKKFIDKFRNLTTLKKKKTKIKVKGDVETALEKFSTSKSLLNEVQKLIRPFPYIPTNDVEGGILFLDDLTYSIISFKGQWFRIKENLKPEDFSIIIKPNLLKIIEWKTKRAIIKLKHAKSHENLTLEKPIRLIWKKKESN